MMSVCLSAAEPGDNVPRGPDTGRWNEDILRVLKGDINDLPPPIPTSVRIFLSGPLPGMTSFQPRDILQT